MHISEMSNAMNCKYMYFYDKSEPISTANTVNPVIRATPPFFLQNVGKGLIIKYWASPSALWIVRLLRPYLGVGSAQVAPMVVECKTATVSACRKLWGA